MTLQELRRKLNIAQQHIDKQELYSSVWLDQETVDLLRDLLPSTTGEAGQALNARLEPPKSGVKPTVGRIVHIHYGDCGCRPAIVVKVGVYAGEDFQRVDVTEFHQHGFPGLLYRVPPSPMENGWHWPQECPDGR